MGKKATGQKKAYYDRQKAVTVKHKLAGKLKRQKRLDSWITKGVKKNGKPILTLEQRKLRAQNRKQLRDAKRVADRKRIRQADQDWAAKNPGKTPRFNRRKTKPTED